MEVVLQGTEGASSAEGYQAESCKCQRQNAGWLWASCYMRSMMPSLCCWLTQLMAAPSPTFNARRGSVLHQNMQWHCSQTTVGSR